MRRRLFLLFVILTAVSAAAQTTSQYSVVKRTFEGMFASGSIKAEFTRDEGNEYKADLYTCTSGRDFLGTDTAERMRSLAQTADAAYEITWLQAVLTQLGYPRDAWSAPLTRYEADLLAARSIDRQREVKEVAIPRIVTALNAYRRRVNPSLPPVTSEGGCGAGEIGVKIRTVPPDGRVEFIPVFFYELCRSQSKDPNDAGRCPYWREPAEGVLFNVAGDYFYRAVWNDGRWEWAPGHWMVPNPPTATWVAGRCSAPLRSMICGNRCYARKCSWTG